MNIDERRAIIREGIAKIAGNRSKPREIDYETADIVLAYEDSQGLAIIEEGILPEFPTEVNDIIEGWRPVTLCEEAYGRGMVKRMLKAGYKLTHPLIEDTDADMGKTNTD